MNAKLHEPGSASEAATPEGSQAALQARRRLLRGSLGAAPVLMVLAPRSVMAGTVTCRAGSAFASINASHPVTAYSCTGSTPDYWRDASASNWPTQCVRNGSNATLFNAVFTAGGYPNSTLLSVLQLTATSGSDGLARYLVAAVLNAYKWPANPTPVISVSIATKMWADYVAKGYYEPTAGIKWYADSSVPAGSGGCITWLKSTLS